MPGLGLTSTLLALGSMAAATALYSDADERRQEAASLAACDHLQAVVNADRTVLQSMTGMPSSGPDPQSDAPGDVARRRMGTEYQLALRQLAVASSDLQRLRPEVIAAWEIGRLGEFEEVVAEATRQCRGTTIP